MPIVLNTGDTDYTSADELKATLDLSDETFADSDIAAAITAASRSIDNTCHRRFYADTDASQIRYFTPRTPWIVPIDDLITLTSIAVDTTDDQTYATTLDATQYRLRPVNAPADEWPYTRINGHHYWFCRRQDSVKVTGMFGWPAVPDNISQATTLLASRLLRRAREAPFGVIGFAMDMGTTAAARIARQDPDVMLLINPYIRQLVR